MCGFRITRVGGHPAGEISTGGAVAAAVSMAQLSGFKGGGGSGSRGVGGEARGSNARPGGRLGGLRIHGLQPAIEDGTGTGKALGFTVFVGVFSRV